MPFRWTFEKISVGRLKDRAEKILATAEAQRAKKRLKKRMKHGDPSYNDDDELSVKDIEAMFDALNGSIWENSENMDYLDVVSLVGKDDAYALCGFMRVGEEILTEDLKLDKKHWDFILKYKDEDTESFRAKKLKEDGALTLSTEELLDKVKATILSDKDIISLEINQVHDYP
jgi:hypothetical protein